MVTVTKVDSGDSAVQFLNRMESHMATGRYEDPDLLQFAKSYSKLTSKEMKADSVFQSLRESPSLFKKCTKQTSTRELSTCLKTTSTKNKGSHK